MSTTGPNTEAEWERYNDMMHDLAQARRDVEAAEKACAEFVLKLADVNGTDEANCKCYVCEATRITRQLKTARARLAEVDRG